MTTIQNNSRLMRWAQEKVVEVFGADLRSLAVFRIVLALLVLVDLASRVTDLSAHYTDAGILPRTVLVEEGMNHWSFSLSLMNGEAFFQALLIGTAALAALSLLVGYRTRLATILVWVLLLSIQRRNPLILSGGDLLLHLLLFWSMFLPLGAYWSVDRALRPVRLSMRFLSLGTLGLFVQIAFVYWFAVFLKSGPEWRVDGTALYYALNWDQIATPVGTYLSQFPDLLKVLTFATLGLEAFGPFLLFCPFFTGLIRTGTVLAFMSLHFGIWLTMDIGLFPWISAFCMVCFLPGWFWDKAARFWAAFPERLAIVRRLQHATARLVHAYWSLFQERVSTVGQSSIADLAVQSGGLGSYVARITTPFRITGDTRHDEIHPATDAKANPETQGAGAAGPEPKMLRSSLATNLLAFFFLLYVFCWNLTTVSEFSLPEKAVPVGYFLGLDQTWRMFAPSPAKNDGWYVIPGTLRDGRQVDLMSITRGDVQPHAVSWEKPEDLYATYKNTRWRKYLERIGQEQYADQRLYFGRYICSEWNEHHTGSQALKTFQITYMLEMTLPDNQRSTPQKLVLWKHSCF